MRACATTLGLEMPEKEKGAVAGAITVADVMVANVLVVHAGDSVDDAVALIVDSRITGVPVVDDDNHILGIVAEFRRSQQAGSHRR